MVNMIFTGWKSLLTRINFLIFFVRMKTLPAKLILKAYANGIFPMAKDRDDPKVFWMNPEFRGVIPLDGFHCSRRLAQKIRSEKFKISVNTSFGKVIRKCAERTVHRQETWINDTIITAFEKLHKTGNAHSIECWHAEELVGGLYGACIGSAFFGESMFSRESDASKIALAYLVKRLKTGAYTLLDTQFLTSHLYTLGAIQLTRDKYLERLKYALKRQATFFPNY